MGPIHLFELASTQARWLSMRQTAVAQNVANASTPGYTAVDVTPFADVYDQYQTTMVATHPAHFGGDAMDMDSITAKATDPWEITHSGNSVSLEQEMIKANEVNRGYSLNTTVVRAFNQMMMASLKG